MSSIGFDGLGTYLLLLAGYGLVLLAICCFAIWLLVRRRRAGIIVLSIFLVYGFAPTLFAEWRFAKREAQLSDFTIIDNDVQLAGHRLLIIAPSPEFLARNALLAGMTDVYSFSRWSHGSWQIGNSLVDQSGKLNGLVYEYQLDLQQEQPYAESTRIESPPEVDFVLVDDSSGLYSTGDSASRNWPVIASRVLSVSG